MDIKKKDYTQSRWYQKMKNGKHPEPAEEVSAQIYPDIFPPESFPMEVANEADRSLRRMKTNFSRLP